MDVRYITSAAKPEQLPDLPFPETAFIGRSNTGKSTLINALLQRQNLARTGKVPGQTQMINFFQVGTERTFVDLPGFGYTAASGLAKRKNWNPLMAAYLNREQLATVVFLKDIRRDFPPEDLDFLKSLPSDVQLVMALTKADKIASSKGRQAVQHTAHSLKSYGIDADDVFAVSSLKKTGIATLKLICLGREH